MLGKTYHFLFTFLHGPDYQVHSFPQVTIVLLLLLIIRIRIISIIIIIIISVTSCSSSTTTNIIVVVIVIWLLDWNRRGIRYFTLYMWDQVVSLGHLQCLQVVLIYMYIIILQLWCH